jgi:hypothetical protein
LSLILAAPALNGPFSRCQSRSFSGAFVVLFLASHHWLELGLAAFIEINAEQHKRDAFAVDAAAIAQARSWLNGCPGCTQECGH